ncbi:MAG: hypothetical protein Q4A76_05060 [Porphyromonadaceae bacterium]|nr:hypothetical protein [Porphyromonadaceae bacterium]
MSSFKKKAAKYVSLTLIVTLLVSTACYISFAAGADRAAKTDKNGKTLSSLVAGTNASGKDETVYVIAGADGSAKEVIVSDWLKNSKGEKALLDDSCLDDIENVKGDQQYTLDKNNMKVWDADGEDIYYQGTTDKQLPVDLAISYTLNGKAVTSKELSGKSGKVTMRIDYRNNEKRSVSINGKTQTMYVPFVMLSGMMLSNDHFSNVAVTNGKVINDGDKCIVMGFALPGMQQNLGVSKSQIDLPSYIEITADVKDFELETTMHFASNDIFSQVDFSEIGSMDDLTAQLNKFTQAANQLVDGSSALYSGLSELLQKSGVLVEGINQLYAGASKLSTGTAMFTDGQKQLHQGLSELNNGLKALTANSGALNAGGEEVFNSLLSMADGQLAQAGVTGLPKLTIANYKTVLNGVLNNLSPENARAMATAEAQKQVTETVRSMSSEITAGVTMKVKEQVLGAVLQQAGLGMTPEQFAGAVAAGKIDEKTVAMINGAVEQQMATDAIKQKVDQLTESVIQQKIAETMAGAQIQAKIEEAVAKAQAGAESVKGLIAQLDKYNMFYSGLCQYTAGVDAAFAGSEKLLAGSTSLIDNSAKLSSGAAELSGGIGSLKAGSGALVQGVTKLANGGMMLSEGMKKFNEEGVKKLTSVFDGNLGELAARLSATADLSKSYNSYAGISSGTKGEVKFVYRTEGISVEKEKK